MNNKKSFPNNFLWGVATAAHQIEGSNHFSDWWQFEKEGKINDGSSSDQGGNSYKNFDKDLALLKKLNVNAYRFSIEWARVEPQKGRWDKEALEYYRDVLIKLRKNQIEPIVGLNHVTLPYWTAQTGGWENNKIVGWITKYTELVCKKLGNLAQYWITMNEPQTTVLTGYLIGYWPPEKKNIISALKVIRNINKAHQKIYHTVHKFVPNAKVSIVNNLPAFRPLNSLLPNRGLAKLISNLNDRLFVKPNIKYSDFIGLNYYFGPKIGLTKFGKVESKPSAKNTPPFPLPINLAIDLKGESGIVSDWGWGAYPQGLTQVVNHLSRYNLPIIITENGIVDAEDKMRSEFILIHLKEIYKLIKKGVDIRGYFHWTLADNFEWREGFSAKLGLATRDRNRKKSSELYSDICRSNVIDV